MTFSLDETNPKHRGFARLAIAQRDIRAAAAAIELATEYSAKEDQRQIYEMLVLTAAILYSRPFVGARRNPAIPGKFSAFDTQALGNLHNDVITFRNRFGAHCDVRDVKVEILTKGTQFRSPDGGIFTVHKHATTVSTRTFSPKGLPLMKELCSFQVSRLSSHIDSMSNRLFPSSGSQGSK
jgi:hypothetical protein